MSKRTRPWTRQQRRAIRRRTEDGAALGRLSRSVDALADMYVTAARAVNTSPFSYAVPGRDYWGLPPREEPLRWYKRDGTETTAKGALDDWIAGGNPHPFPKEQP